MYGTDEHGRPRAICNQEYAVCVQPASDGDPPEFDAGEPPDLPDGGTLPLSAAISSPVETAYTSDSITLTVATTGRPDVIELLRNGVFVSRLSKPYEYTWNTSGFAEGEYVFHVRARKGSTQVLSEPRVVHVDRTVPQISSRYPEPESAAIWSTEYIKIGFSEPLLRESVVSSHFEVTNRSVVVTVSEDGLSVYLGLVPGIVGGDDVTVVSKTGPTDRAGNLLLESRWKVAAPLLMPMAPSVATSPGLGQIRDPAILLDAKGWFVAYSEYSGDAFNIRVKVGPEWTEMGGPISAVQGNGTNASSPRLIRGPSGNLVLAFVETDNTGAPIVFVYEWSGSAWVLFGSQPNAAAGLAPSLAMSQGVLYLSAGTRDVFKWSAGAWVGIPTHPQLDPVHAVVGTSKIYAFLRSFSRPAGFEYDFGSAVWKNLDAPVRVPMIAGTSQIQAGSFSAGTLCVVWIADTGDPFIGNIVQMLRHANGAWEVVPGASFPRRVEWPLSISAYPKGVAVAFASNVSGTKEVMVSRVFDNGGWEVPHRLRLGAVPIGSSQPQAALGTDGRLYVVAVEERGSRLTLFGENR